MMKKVLIMFLLVVMVFSFTGCSSKPTSTVCSITNTIGKDDVTLDYDKDGKITKYTSIYVVDVTGLGYEDDYYTAMAEAYKQALEEKNGFSYDYKIENSTVTETLVMDASVGSVEDGLWLNILPTGTTAETLTKDGLTKLLTDKGYACTEKK